jgi:hypothetical protein
MARAVTMEGVGYLRGRRPWTDDVLRRKAQGQLGAVFLASSADGPAALQRGVTALSRPP